MYHPYAKRSPICKEQAFKVYAEEVGVLERGVRGLELDVFNVTPDKVRALCKCRCVHSQACSMFKMPFFIRVKVSVFACVFMFESVCMDVCVPVCMCVCVCCVCVCVCVCLCVC